MCIYEWGTSANAKATPQITRRFGTTLVEQLLCMTRRGRMPNQLRKTTLCQIDKQDLLAASEEFSILQTQKKKGLDFSKPFFFSF
jgi:hypothetical protein